MRTILLISAALLFLSVIDLPIGYYTFLRIVITGGAIAVIFKEFKNEFTPWVIIFGLVAILFNPIIPIYLGDKDVWIPIDIIVGILFLVKGIKSNVERNNTIPNNSENSA